MIKLNLTKEELGIVFDNAFDCYADTRVYDADGNCDDTEYACVPAMTRDTFIKVLLLVDGKHFIPDTE